MTRNVRRARGLALLALGFLLASCQASPNIRFTRVDEPMPALSGPTLQGGRLSPADYRGKLVLVNFWATWCAPCRREQPGLESLWRKLRPSGRVMFIGVDYRDDADAAREWIRRYRVTYPSVSDPDGRLGERFGVPFLPTTVLVAADGRMQFRLVGEQEADLLEGLLQTVARFGSRPTSGPLAPPGRT